MSTRNLFSEFKRLAGGAPLLVGEVESVSTGNAVVRLPDGQRVQALGEATVGLKVFVQGGVIQGQAPSLTLVTVTL